MTLRTAALAAAFSVLLVAPVLPQSALPRTPDGHPDLQGTWRNDTVTPLERPARFADKEFLSVEEAAAFERNYDTPDGAAVRVGAIEERVTGELIWPDHGKLLPSRRTSLIIDPANGRIPYNADAQARITARASQGNVPPRPPEGPEDLALGARCLLFGAGPPMTPPAYNQNVQIVQAAGSVMILNEMIHDARVIPLDGRPHLPASIRQWRGDPRGHWAGDVLVVESTNFTAKTQFSGSGEQLRLTERFSLVDNGTLRYEFTLDDPTVYTAPWTAALTMTKTDDQLFEYACHEGNHDMDIILRAAREADEPSDRK